MSVITSQEAQLLQERLARNRAGGINRGKADPLKALPSEQVAASAVDLGAVDDEEELHNAIIKHCRKRRWIYFHGSMAIKTYRTLGEPDFHIYLPGGKYLLIECKSATGTWSEDQIHVRQQLGRLDHFVYEVRSMEQFLKLAAEKMLPGATAL